MRESVVLSHRRRRNDALGKIGIGHLNELPADGLLLVECCHEYGPSYLVTGPVKTAQFFTDETITGIGPHLAGQGTARGTMVDARTLVGHVANAQQVSVQDIRSPRFWMKSAESLQQLHRQIRAFPAARAASTGARGAGSGQYRRYLRRAFSFSRRRFRGDLVCGERRVDQLLQMLPDRRATFRRQGHESATIRWHHKGRDSRRLTGR
jgi:hypothetical protein